MATTAHAAFTRLQSEIRACTLCAEHLPLGPRPVLQAHPAAKILIVGQAPGTAVHRTGIPFNDPSGDRLRTWLGVDRDERTPNRAGAYGLLLSRQGKGRRSSTTAGMRSALAHTITRPLAATTNDHLGRALRHRLASTAAENRHASERRQTVAAICARDATATPSKPA